MTDIERYHLQLDHCAKRAGEAATGEIRELWLTIASTYRFLLERAERIALESRTA
jgi:hypothetical protein